MVLCVFVFSSDENRNDKLLTFVFCLKSLVRGCFSGVGTVVSSPRLKSREQSGVFAMFPTFLAYGREFLKIKVLKNYTTK